MTIFSPNTVATDDTRTSIWRPSTLVENWPSCGARFSTMFISDMILSRLMSAIVGGQRQLDGLDELAVDAEPDHGDRSSSGSMWMSEARSRNA